MFLCFRDDQSSSQAPSLPSPGSWLGPARLQEAAQLLGKDMGMKRHRVRTRLFTRHTGCNSHLHPKIATEDKADPLSRHWVGFPSPTQNWNCTPATSATSSRVLRGERASSKHHCHPSSHSSSPAEEEQRMCTAHSSYRELPDMSVRHGT